MGNRPPTESWEWTAAAGRILKGINYTIAALTCPPLQHYIEKTTARSTSTLFKTRSALPKIRVERR